MVYGLRELKNKSRDHSQWVKNGDFLLFDAAHSDMRRLISPKTGAWPSLLWTDESQAVFSVHIDSILQIFIHVKDPQWKCGNRFKTKFMFKNHNRKYHTTVYIDC